jgi:uncharacterized protein YndB with AHSA1/START domain
MKTKLTGKVNIHINAPVSKVWNALTDPEQIKKYFFGTNTVTDWQPGHPVQFTGEWEGKTYEDKGTVLQNDGERLLSYNYWSSMSGTEDKPENYATVTYELQNTGSGTELIITQDNIADEKSKAHSEKNWNDILNGLKELVEHGDKGTGE